MRRFDSDTDLIIVSSHYTENLDWLEQSHVPVIVSSNSCTPRSFPEGSCVYVDPKLNNPINRGREASAYIRFIVTYYEMLPKHIAFIHGHENAWHQKYPGPLLKAIQNAKYHEFPFISLNMCHSEPELLDEYKNIYWRANRQL